MIHLQRTVPNWLEAVQRLPDRALVKSVDQGQVFREVKSINPSIYTCLRHHYDHAQHFGGSQADNFSRARQFFESFIDQTFVTDIAPYCDFIEEWNEYLANSQGAAELKERLSWAQAAAEIWQNEYRIRPELAHIRLVLCNTAVGNWIPKTFFSIAQAYDCLMGYHPYIHCPDGLRSVNDWQNQSGLFEVMEHKNGLKVDWLFTEAGPYESAVTGWRAPECLAGDAKAYTEIVKDWIQDVKATDAYQEGRILGFALFTTGRAGNSWRSFWTEQPELNRLAAMIAEEWDLSADPIPDPQPPPPANRGRPRIQYKRKVNVIADTATSEEAAMIFKEAWRKSRETVTGSYDDAGIGDLQDRTAVLWSIPKPSHAKYLEWFRRHYPGVKVIFESLGGLISNFSLTWPLESPARVISPGGKFNEGRYYGRHEGIDLIAKVGDKVFAAADGKVIWADSRRRSNGQASEYGNHVIIDHGRGFISWYGHLDTLSVSTGEGLNGGDQVGTAGSTGNSSGPHLHFSLQIIGQGLGGYILPDVVDPSPYLDL